MSKLYFILGEGQQLLSADSNGLSDPYAKIEIKVGSKKHNFKSKTIYKTLDPVWNEVFEVPHITVEDLANTHIKVELWDWDFGFSHDSIGSVEIPSSTLKSKVKMNSEAQFKEKVLEPGKGFLVFSLKLSDSTQDNVKELTKKASIKRESKRNQVELDPEVLNDKIKSLEKSKKEELAEMSTKLVKELKAKKLLNDQIDELKKKSEEQVKNLKTENDEKVKDLEEKLSKKDKEMEDVMIESFNDVNAKQAQLDEMKKKYKELEEKFENEKVSKNEGLGDELKNLKESFQAKFDNELKESTKEIEDLKQKLAASQKKEKDLKDELTKRDEKITQLTQVNKTQKDELIKLQDANSALNKEKEVLEGELLEQLELVESLKVKKEPKAWNDILEKVKKNTKDFSEVVFIDDGVTDKHVAELCQALFNNDQVLKLDFTNNEGVTGEFSKAFCEMLLKTKSVMEVCFSGCPVKKDKIEEIKKALKSNHTLVQCQLGKFETKQDVQEIEELMERNFQIQSQ